MITNEDKKEILRLRFEEYWTFTALGIKYGLDHTTIMYHCEDPNRLVQERGRSTRQWKIPDKNYIPTHFIKNIFINKSTKEWWKFKAVTIKRSQNITKKLQNAVKESQNLDIVKINRTNKSGLSYEEYIKRDQEKEIIRDEKGNILDIIHKKTS